MCVGRLDDRSRVQAQVQGFGERVYCDGQRSSSLCCHSGVWLWCFFFPEILWCVTALCVCILIIKMLCFLLQNEDQMSMSSPVDNQFFRMLLEEEGSNLRELLDAEEYLVPQPNHFPSTHNNGIQSNGTSRHQSFRVSEGSDPLGCACNCMCGSSISICSSCWLTLKLFCIPNNNSALLFLLE